MDDLISRQAAIDEAKEWIDAVYFEENDKRERKAIECFIGSLKNMPSAETSKRTGKSAQNVPNDDLISRKAAIEAVDATWWNARGIRKTIQELPSAQPELIEKTAYIRGFEQGRTQGMIDTKAEEVAQPEPQWIPCSERLPENTEPVNITWVNRKPELYYADIKNKPFTATGHYHNGKWWWYSVVCQDYLDEYGKCEMDEMDRDIEVIAWMPLPEPYKGEES